MTLSLGAYSYTTPSTLFSTYASMATSRQNVTNILITTTSASYGVSTNTNNPASAISNGSSPTIAATAHHKLSGGAIAGIVVGSVVGVPVLATISFLFITTQSS